MPALGIVHYLLWFSERIVQLLQPSFSCPVIWHPPLQWVSWPPPPGLWVGGVSNKADGWVGPGRSAPLTLSDFQSYWVNLWTVPSALLSSYTCHICLHPCWEFRFASLNPWRKPFFNRCWWWSILHFHLFAGDLKKEWSFNDIPSTQHSVPLWPLAHIFFQLSLSNVAWQKLSCGWGGWSYWSFRCFQGRG